MTANGNPFEFDYASFLVDLHGLEMQELWRQLTERMKAVWIEDYETMIGGMANIYQFEADKGFFTLFDLVDERVGCASDGSEEETDSRVVAVFGQSQLPRNRRDINRQRGFLGPSTRVLPDGYEKGHFIAYSFGGGMDSNLFPQKKSLNRGWSAEGKRYRAMEKYCADHVGTHCFVRPVYDTPTWIPSMLEFGILKDDKQLWVGWFQN
ncbi:DNA/RNA non-specific endonuclease [Candidatus Magnetaquicoccus inordinatus]|uniref:DNA/RNA non-specific endonuclease n=1 Tax=Candidatus Magnetaquicoccus inordinatus TaxID=2496818 RepID=UPI00102CD494|nr:DNA/RNA non-specific endonuclease [Candidatus Magnetaquicoccus inordinatus]